MKNNSLTEGVIWKNLLFFALPLLGTSFIQQLYNTVDLIYVGNFLGKEAAAAVGASSLFVTCLVGFFSGMSVGSSVVASYVFGTGDKKELKNVVHTAIGLGFICGIIIMFIGLIGAPYFLELINTPDEIMGLAVSYIRVYFISIVSVVTYNMGSGIIRALGNSKTPMYIQLIGGVINVIMDGVFIVVFNFGVVGVAWATLFSQTVAAVLVLHYLMHVDSEFKLDLTKISIAKAYFYKILKIGVPAGVQALVITISNVFVQYHVNSLGVDAITAFTAYFKVELMIYLPILAIGQAITTFTSQNIGAENYDRVKKGTRVCLLMGIGITALMSTFVLILGRQAFGVINSDPSVVDYGIQIISITLPFYWIYLILEVLGGTIRGAGKAVPPMAIILTNICVLRTILLFVTMSSSQDIQGIAITYPITWTSTALCMAIYYWQGNWMGEFKRLSVIKSEI
ncbi:MATE family efflux transporter [Acetobacterium bakii]|uniref:Multidrug transporter n=1 Tax=Acetobacterium bakii TaxID=52689 RepID=A0A0L6TXZ3_9FIRM|nr:MATE family efflux transporter [Acetobacterium bakii]KNZ41136.1 multidrug transporter [Acetobacterium bakii]